MTVQTVEDEVVLVVASKQATSSVKTAELELELEKEIS